MTTPSPSEQPKRPAVAGGTAAREVPQAAQETVDKAWQQTPAIGTPNQHATAEQNLEAEDNELRDALPNDLSPRELAQATAALGFLKEVKTAVRESVELPKSIGGYSIVRSLGRGGFAEVFLAHDEELDRPVALKIPLFHADLNADARIRFEREARLAASLGHPQIVPVYEFGDIGPVRFIALAWCGGPTLGDWVAQHGPVDFRTAALIIAHLADAAQHAHQRGIVHRDLKPANVLVDNGEGHANEPIWKQVRITDFGLARQFDVEDTSLTREGQIIGTPAYMAPEQASGKFDAGPPADIWALGMMLFELLTGETPFRRPSLLATIKAISGESVPLARSLRRDVPRGLEAIADRCLRKAPEARYPSAHELAEDLRRWLHREPVQARRMSSMAKLGLWMRRNPVLAASVSLTIASLALGLGVALWQRDAALKNLAIAQAQTTRGDRNLDTAQTLINDIIKLERKLRLQSELAPERGVLVKRAAELQVELVRDETQTPKIRYDTAMTLADLSRLLVQLGEREAAIENATKVLELLEGLEHELPEGVSHYQIYQNRFQQRLAIGSVLSLNGQAEEAMKQYRANEAEVVPASIPPLQKAIILAENLRAESVLCQFSGNHEGSSIALSKALRYFDDIELPEQPTKKWTFLLSQCRLHNGLVSDETALGRLTLAEQHLKLAEDCLPKLAELFPKHPVLQDTISTVAWHGGGLYLKMNRPADAVAQFKTCRDTQLSLFEANPSITNTANFYVFASLSMAQALLASDSSEAAAQAAEEVIERAASFPDSVKASQAFKDNMRGLQQIARGQAEQKPTKDVDTDLPECG